MSKFTLTAQLVLAAPKNVGTIIADLRNRLRSVNIPLNVKIPPNVANDLNKLTNALGKTQKQAQATKDAFEDFIAKSSLAGKRFLYYTIATAGFIKLSSAISDATKEAIDFQHEMVKIAQITGLSYSGLADLNTEITKLSTSLGVSSTKLLNAAQVLAQAGLSAEDTKTALQALAKSDISPTFENMTDTAEGAIAIFSQFKIKAEELEGVLGSINAVSGKFAVESGDLITAIRRTGGAFSSAGGSINELLGLFTSIRATTRESAESIATGFRTIFTRIQRIRTVKFLENLGIQLRDAEGQFVGPIKAVERLSAALNNIKTTDPRFAQIIEELGGFRQVSKVIPLLQEFELAQKAIGVAALGQKSLTEDAIKAQQSWAIQIAKVREEFLALIREISNDTAFKSIIKAVLELTSATIKFVDAFKPVIPFITALGFAKLGAFAGPTIKKTLGFSSGGLVPGSGNGDTVPAMLEPGEFVLRKSAVKALGVSGASHINKYAFGGKVTANDIKDKKAEAIISLFAEKGISINQAQAKKLKLFQNETALESLESELSGAGNKPQVDISKLPSYGLVSVYGQSRDKSFVDAVDIDEIREIKIGNNTYPYRFRAKSLNKDNADNITNSVRPILNTAVEKFSKQLGTQLQADIPSVKLANENAILGSIFESSLFSLGAPYSEDEQRRFDFANGLNNAASVFGNEFRNIPTEAKYAYNKSSLESFRGKVASDIVNRPVQKFAKGGLVPSLLTPGELVIDKGTASKIGYGTLEKINRFAGGGSVTHTHRPSGGWDDISTMTTLPPHPSNRSSSSSSINIRSTGFSGRRYVNKSNPIEQHTNIIALAALGTAALSLSQQFDSLGDNIKSVAQSLGRMTASFITYTALTKEFIRFAYPEEKKKHAISQIAKLEQGIAAHSDVPQELKDTIQRRLEARVRLRQELRDLRAQPLSIARTRRIDKTKRAIDYNRSLIIDSAREYKDTEAKNKVIVARKQELIGRRRAYLAGEERAQRSAIGVSIAGSIAGELGTYIAGRGQANITAGNYDVGSNQIKTGGALAGAGAGAAIGASLGSIIPGIGTVLGGAIGGLVGGIAGFTLSLEEADNAITKAKFDRIFPELSRTIDNVVNKKTYASANIGNISAGLNTAFNLYTSASGDTKENLLANLKNQTLGLETAFSEVITTLTKSASAIKSNNEIFEDFRSSVSQQTLEQFATISNLPVSSIEKRFNELIVSTRETIKIQNAFSVSIANLNTYFDDISSVSLAFRELSATIELNNTSLSVLSDSANKFESVLGDITDISTLSATQFNLLQSQSSNALAFAGPIGSQAINNASQAYNLEKLLPQLLTVANSEGGLGGSGLVQNIQNEVAKFTNNPDLLNVITSGLSKILGEEGKPQILQEKLNAPGGIQAVAKELSEGFKGIYDTLNEANKSFIDVLNRESELFQKRRELESSITESLSKELDIRESFYEHYAAVFNVSGPNKAAQQQQFNIERLSNILGPNLLGATGGNITNMSNSLIGAKQNLVNLNRQYQTSPTNQLNVAINDQKDLIAKLKSGLEFIANPANTSAVALQKLADASEKARGAFEKEAEFAFGSIEDQMRLQQTIEQVQILAQSGGDISSVRYDKRRDVQSYLTGIGAKEDILGGLTGEQLYKNVIEKTALGRGANPLDAKAIAQQEGFASTDAVQALTDLKTSFTASIEAQKVLTQSLEFDRKELNDILTNLFSNFTNRLQAIFTQNFINNKTTQIALLQAQRDAVVTDINKAQGVFGKATSLGIGGFGERQLNNLLSGRKTIEDFIKVQGSEDTLNKLESLIRIVKLEADEPGDLFKAIGAGSITIGSVVTDKDIGTIIANLEKELGGGDLSRDVGANVLQQFRAKGGKASFGQVIEMIQSAANEKRSISNATRTNFNILSGQIGADEKGLISLFQSKEFQNLANTYSGQAISISALESSARKARLEIQALSDAIDTLRKAPNQADAPINNINPVGRNPIGGEGLFNVDSEPMRKIKVAQNAAGVSSNALEDAIKVFSTSSNQLVEAMNNFPREIELKGTHTVEVLVNGAQVLQNIMPEVKTLVEETVKSSINNMLQKKFPQVGKM